jgi:hypothetical protein
VVCSTALWIAAGAAPWWISICEERAAAGEMAASAAFPWTWADAPARVAARRMLLEGYRVREAEIEALLRWSARARPLYAPTWLTLAELAYREGRSEQADAYAERSMTLWPGRPRLVWKVAVLRVEMGDSEGAFRALRAYLRITERTIPQVVLVAERLEPDPRALVSRLIPDRESPAARAWLSELRELALWKRDADLAREAGAALPPSTRVTWAGEANG